MNKREERRRHVRASPKGTVVTQVSSHLVRGRVINVSRGGLSMRTRITPPEEFLGAKVDLALRLDGRDASWRDLGGRILRIGANSIALELDAPPDSFVRILDETISASQDNARLLSVVLVDATGGRREEMAEAFRRAGCAVIDVSTPLEAIVRLGESDFEPDLIAIADSLPATISQELRRFVDLEHPWAKLVTIGETAPVPDGLASWLSEANPDDDLAARIRAVLTTWASVK
jgi:hypothetical protein